MKKPITTILVLFVAATGFGETLKEKIRAKEVAAAAAAASTPSPTVVPKPGEKERLDLGEMGGTLLYKKLLKFEYNPSQRDPFVSHVVVSPFVTEEDLPPPVDIDKEKIKAAVGMVENLVKKKIQVGGISSGREGAGYAIGNEGQIIKPGEYLFITLEEKEQDEVTSAMNIANTAGMPLLVTTYKNKIVVETKKVEEKTVRFMSPVRAGSDAAGEITVEYIKQMGFEKTPQPGDLEKKKN